MDVTGYAVIGAGAVLLLVVILTFLLRSRRRDTSDEVPAIREEPTLVPQDEEDAAPTADEAPEAFAEAAAPEPMKAGSQAQPEPEPEPESESAPAAEAATASRSEAESEASPDPQPQPEPQEPPSESVPRQAETPDPESDPAFVAARARLDEELQAGHFSRLDVFEEYQRASEKAYGHIGPRSEYFSRVVNEAIAVRDAFEVLLNEEDRGRFVDGHSRYLDEVSVEVDGAARVRMHREQIELLHQLRPGVAAEQAEA